MEMKVPAGTGPFLKGALAGAIALAIVGFHWGGWFTGSGAEKMAAGRADKAVVTALTPVCIAQFRKSPNAPATLKTFKGLNSWEQGEYLGKAGWATMPGATGEPDRELVTSCVDALNNLTL